MVMFQLVVEVFLCDITLRSLRLLSCHCLYQHKKVSSIDQPHVWVSKTSQTDESCSPLSYDSIFGLFP